MSQVNNFPCTLKSSLGQTNAIICYGGRFAQIVLHLEVQFVVDGVLGSPGRGSVHPALNFLYQQCNDHPRTSPQKER